MFWSMAIGFLITSMLAVILYLALEYLSYKLKHERKVATGHFKVTMPEKDWNEGVSSEAFAVAVKDQATGAVMLTLVVEKEKK